MKDSAISWTGDTWNPWRGCTKISPGCKNCYMFRDQRRYGLVPETVVRTTKAKWRDPIRRQRQLAMTGRTARVFTCSWSDWFHEAADEWRPEAWTVIKACSNIDFQILTKRPRRILNNLPADWGTGYPNVWLGVSVEREDYLWRVEELTKVPAAIRFISAEPLLGPLQLDLHGLDWVIVGGESGPGYRRMDPEWARQIRHQCQAAGVSLFFKQQSGRLPGADPYLDGERIQEYPRARRALGQLPLFGVG